MFERPQSGERAILVYISWSAQPDQDELQEFEDLVISAGADPMRLVTGSRRAPDKRFYVGSGKAEEISLLVKELEAELVIFDHELSPSQERNLEALFKCRVLDRTGLILDIFAQRARSFEGKLQVELAQLRHLSTRLVRGWTHLERQKGGIGLRGPGETQLETDRRLLNQRVKQIRRRLARVNSQREQGRQARRRAEVPTVSLVGYTNAGKSTLFNRLTEAQVYAEDQLFATLDPTLRRLDLGDHRHLILADTVGFISRLPHELVTAFKSTLQETVEAALLIHVIDVSSQQRGENIAEVENVLKQIGADKVPLLEVYNKIDLMEHGEPRVDSGPDGKVSRIWLSAQTGEGIDLLLETLKAHFQAKQMRCQVSLSAEDGRQRALLFDRGTIISEQPTEEGGWEIEVELTSKDKAQLEKLHPGLARQIIEIGH